MSGRTYIPKVDELEKKWVMVDAKGQILEKPFLYEVIPSIVSVMKKGYPEVDDASHSVAVTLKGEEERFLDTLETGLQIPSPSPRFLTGGLSPASYLHAGRAGNIL